MACLLHKLIRKQSYQRIFTSFNHRHPSNLIAPPFLHQPHLSETKLDIECNLNSSTKEKVTHSHELQIYPSFPFGYCLNPISPSGLDPLQSVKAEGFESDDSHTVWADSVKKKRKRKMNKHKYRKLRKRLRRRT